MIRSTHIDEHEIACIAKSELTELPKYTSSGFSATLTRVATSNVPLNSKLSPRFLSSENEMSVEQTPQRHKLVHERLNSDHKSMAQLGNGNTFLSRGAAQLSSSKNVPTRN